MFRTQCLPSASAVEDILLGVATRLGRHVKQQATSMISVNCLHYTCLVTDVLWYIMTCILCLLFLICQISCRLVTAVLIW